MIDKEKFFGALDKVELDRFHDLSAEEIHAIIDYCMNDEDPIYLAVWMGFLCGCMKAGVCNS